MSKEELRLSPAKLEILKILNEANNPLGFNEIRSFLKKPGNKEGKISPKGLSDQLHALESMEAVKNFHRKWQITPIGKETLERHKFAQNIASKPVQYSKDIIFKIDTEFIYHRPWCLSNSEYYPSPLPVTASFFGSEEIEYMINFAKDHHLYHDDADIREFSGLVLEENVTPLKPYLNETIFTNCVEIGCRYEAYKLGESKQKPKIDIDNALNFDWGVALRFNGKDLIRELSSVKKARERKEAEERLVGFVLLNLPFRYQHGCDYIIPAMVEGGLIKQEEGKELQKLYEKIYGKIKPNARIITHESNATGEEKEMSRELFQIKALEHLKKGKGFYVAKKGTHGIEGSGLTEDDVIDDLIKKIREGPKKPEVYEA